MEKFKLYEQMIIEELIVAMGCTEPISLSLAGAKLVEVLGDIPEELDAYICGNIIKNAKSVTVPNTDGMKGIDTAIAAGMVVGKSSAELEVLTTLSKADLDLVKDIITRKVIKINLATNCKNLYIKLVGRHKQNIVEVVIEDLHNNITYVAKNGNELYKKADILKQKKMAYDTLNVKDIIDFANNADLSKIEFYLKRQLEYNYKIACEGINGNYGVNTGRILLKTAQSVKDKAKAYTAAASDERMAGCDMPVVIISGSGNQGITTSVPLYIYKLEYNIPEERLLRALIVADLIALEEKNDIGRLSAFCGAVSAGAAAAAGIAYLLGGDEKVVAHTLVNALALSSGIICDGAKSSCAGKIVLALEAGLIGYEMYQHHMQIRAGEGIVKKGVDQTIKNVGRLASCGMIQTDKEILSMMIED